MTDVFTTSFARLQLATGRIDEIDVIVPLGDGRFELAVGFVPSYYEFWHPASELRFTDEEWHALLLDWDAELPLRPSWTASMLATDRPIADDWYVEF